MTTDPAYRLAIGFEAYDAEDAVRRLEATGAGAVILFARNIRDATQTRSLIAEIRDRTDRPLLFCVDQEGGNVVRCTRDVTVFPGNMALGATGSVDLATRQGQETGRQLRALGFNLNLAPVLDLARTSDNPGIGQRSFGADPHLAARLGAALVLGMQRAGVGATLKHFPGAGCATVDSHIDLPIIDSSPDELRAIDLEPFRHVIEADAAAVMSTHMVYRGFGDEVPATFSSRIARKLLRDELGFRGLVTSDCLEMGAIQQQFGMEDAVVRCARSGHDLLFVCHTLERQERSARRLRQALEAGELDPDENRYAIDRIQAWCAPAAGALEEVDIAAGDDLAREIAAASVSLLEDPHGLLPLRPELRTHVLFPRLRALVAVEEEVGAEITPFLSALLAERLRSFEITTFDLDPDAAEIERIVTGASDSEQVLLFTYDAAFQDGQRRLVQTEALSDARCVHIHLRNPFDQALVPGRCAGVALWGYRRSQIAAGLRALFGEIPFRGKCPVSI